MRKSWVLLALFAAACGEANNDRVTAEPSAAPRDLSAPAQVSKAPAVVPLPEDRAQLDRMILAGYTPHADHLHAPGVESCPMAKGTEAVM